YQLDAPILRTAVGGLVGSNEMRLAVAVRLEPIAGYALAFKVLDHGSGAPLRQLHVIRFAADNVAVTVDLDRNIRILLQDVGGFVKNRFGVAADLRLVEIE